MIKIFQIFGERNKALNLNYIYSKALRKDQLTESEFRFVESYVSSQNVEHAIMADSVLLLAGTAEQRTLAHQRLRQTCAQRMYSENHQAIGVLVTILEYFSKQQFLVSSCFSEFLFFAARHPFLGARINAMRALRQLASIGNGRAAELLRESLNDPHPLVREAAQTSLRLSGLGA